MPKTFLEYSQKYLGKYSAMGDLARDIKADKNNRIFASGNSEDILAYLKAKNACEECINAFRRMWKQYRRWCKNNA